MENLTAEAEGALRRSIEILAKSFGDVQRPIDETELRKLYQTQDYTGMVRYIGGTLHLGGVPFRIGFVNKGGLKNTPAWVDIPHSMPLYGTSELRRTAITIHIRKRFLRESTFEAVVMMLAHELSHVVLRSLRHEFAEKEKAVDLAAMFLGYRNFYRRGCVSRVRETTEPPVSWSAIIRRTARVLMDFFRFGFVPTMQRVGYLSFTEVATAADIMDTMAQTK